MADTPPHSDAEITAALGGSPDAAPHWDPRGSIAGNFLGAVEQVVRPNAGETRLGGIGNIIKSAVLAATQLTPEGRAIRQQSAHEDAVQNMRNQQLRITLAAKDPSLLLLPEMAKAYDSALGKGAADMALVKYAQEQHQNEIGRAHV